MTARVLPLRRPDPLGLAADLDAAVLEWRAACDEGDEARGRQRKLEERIAGGDLVVRSGPRRGRPLTREGRERLVRALRKATAACARAQDRELAAIAQCEHLGDALEVIEGRPLRVRPWRTLRGAWAIHATGGP